MTEEAYKTYYYVASIMSTRESEIEREEKILHLCMYVFIHSLTYTYSVVHTQS